MTTQDRAKKLLEEFQKANEESNRVYWTKAECLSIWKKDGSWKYLFDGEGTWGEFLGHLGVPTSSAGQKIHNWDFFITKHGFELKEVLDKDTSCLYYIARSKQNATKTEVKSLLKQMEGMTRDEFLEQFKGGCLHEETEEITEVVERCLNCKRKIPKIR